MNSRTPDDAADVRSWLRSIPMSGGSPPESEPPDESVAPQEMFLRWLGAAVEDRVAEPQVATLSTADASGAVDARTLLLRDIDSSGWWFSGPASSAKGEQIAENPSAALTFYWREHARQVRVTGIVIDGDRASVARDFNERSEYARAVAAGSRQSDVLDEPADYTAAVDAAAETIRAEPDFVPDQWRAWCLQPRTVEFWQAGSGGRHLRWRYRRRDGGAARWALDVLWP